MTGIVQGSSHKDSIMTISKVRAQSCAGARGVARGSTLVEFAMVLPILLMVSMLIIQYGLILNTALALTHLAREGARYAAVNPVAANPTGAGRTIDSDIEDNMQSKASLGNTVTDAEITVTPTDAASRVPNSEIKVTITYNMKKKMFLPSKFFNVGIFGSGTYTTSTTMRIE